MHIHKFNSIKYIFSTIRGSFIPSMLLLCALVFFYAQQPFEFPLAVLLHYLFLGISCFSLVLLYTANQAKPFFTILVSLAAYLIINHLKTQYGDSFINSPEFQCLSFALPLNLFALHFLPQSKLSSAGSKYTLLILLTEAVFLQNVCGHMTQIPYIEITLEAIPLQAGALWCIFLFLILIGICLKNSILNTGLFYAGICIMMELIYANTVSGLVMFALGSAMLLLSSIIIDLYHRYHYDYLEFVGSKNAYLSHANSKFPFKYTIALYSIDNRDKLLQIYGPEKLASLEQMIINKIRELPYELTFYRYNDAELIMVFKNEDARHTYEFAENIRRTIAASEFIFTSRKSLKITISICISEKTRKDLNASEVTERAHNALHKNYRFNCNITTKA